MLLPVEAGPACCSCCFTEPFFTITFDSATGKVTWVSADETDPDTGKPIPKVLAEGRQARDPRQCRERPELRLANGSETLLDLQLTGRPTTA